MELKLRYLIAILVVIASIGTASAWTDSDGNVYTRHLKITISNPPAEHAQYRVVINGQTIEVYNVTNNLKISGSSGQFWSLVQSTGDDIRVFNDSGSEMHFWLKNWDYVNQTATIEVNLTDGSRELNIAYGNTKAAKSTYNNPEKTLEWYDNFDTDTTSRYTLYGGGSPWVWNSGEGVLQISGNPQRAKAILPVNLTDFIAEVDVLTTGDFGSSGILGRYDDVNKNYYTFVAGFYGNNIAIQKSASDSPADLITSGKTINPNTWYHITAKIKGSKLELDIGGTSVTVTDTSYASGSLGLYTTRNSDDLAKFDNLRVYKYSDPANFASITDVDETINNNNEANITVSSYFTPVRKPFLIIFDLPFIKQKRAELLLPTVTQGYDIYNFNLNNTTDKEELYAILYEVNSTNTKAQSILKHQENTTYGQFYIENYLGESKSKIVFIPGTIGVQKFRILLISHPVWWEKIAWKLGFLPKLTQNTYSMNNFSHEKRMEVIA
jgi:hypothetical protein